jgi:hypothetical protein
MSRYPTGWFPSHGHGWTIVLTLRSRRTHGRLIPVDDTLDSLVDSWLTLPDVAERLGVDVRRVRQLLRDSHLAGVRRGERDLLSVPEAFLAGDHPVPELRGTLTVLHDAGFAPAEAITWLFTPDETLPGTPIEALRAGRKTEIRRRAQALAF